ncbi:multi-sensor signal transduction histidine kinase [Geobacter metallireducens RCH3]|uniref:histidine kinase n=2 Tax=Geobacter metallireducens TaxID=28232 RepID=Q39YT1_GEOMG|nr:ATP-binding protein [Geobacter metallireducens]ABB30593.1 response receiver histidine kinase [Geobacter metallireducens GS-15]EHP87979.1 multi-sensor signal transduction histidine kinase [Geobacter metallireducens RCH3]
MDHQLRMLILEDSEDDLLLLLRELRRGGIDPVYERTETDAGMRALLDEREWDVIIADYNMPRFGAMVGLEIVKERELDIPFIIVSGKIGEDLAVAAMKAGAHDYLMKGNLSRLVPAIEREVREAGERRRRRQAEAAMRNQFNQISTIFDSLNALVYVVDMDSYRLLYLNKYGAQLFGENWEGRPCHEVIQGGKTLPCDFCTNDKLLLDGKALPPYIWEYKNMTTGRWYQCIDKAIRWTDDRLVRMEIAIDITERKEMERMKDEMISAVSHEMHTPLTAMIGFTEFLLENEVDREQQKNCLQTIHKETERLSELINNFLQLQRLKASMVKFRIMPVSVGLLLADAAALYTAASRKHTIVVECPPDLPPVRGNEEQLYQVAGNLISNAIKYSPAGGTVTLGGRADDDMVVFWVKDNGVGISPEFQERVFERFFRVDNSDRRKVGGAGLGLTLVREIVAAHGGRVWVESTPDAGSTFFVSLPRMK